MQPAPSPAELRIVHGALGAAVGPALVLDRELRVVAATEGAVALLGGPVQHGAPATKVLCRNSPKRELAQSLVEGRPIETRIPHPGQHAQGRLLRVRAISVGEAPREGGFLLLLDEGYAGAAGPVAFHGMWTESLKCATCSGSSSVSPPKT